MRLTLWVLLLACAVSAQDGGVAKVAQVSGKVVDGRGEPVAQAAVKLIGSETVNGTTGSDGTFTIAGVKAGTYALIAQKNGFLSQKYGAQSTLVRSCVSVENTSGLTDVGVAILRRCIVDAPGTMLTLAAGDAVRELSVTLVSQGSIAGQVTDRDGEPLQRWRVLALQRDYDRGVRRFRAVTSASTDPDGNYRVEGLAPGRYYLVALDMTKRMFGGLSGEVRGKAAGDADLATFYPSAAEVEQATGIDVGPGDRLLGMNLAIRRGRVFAVRGKVSAPADSGPVSDQLLSLKAKNSSEFVFQENQTTRVASDGSFEFREVEAGEYAVIGGDVRNGNPGAAPTLFGETAVVVSAGDVEGVEVALGPGVSMAGSVRMVDGSGGPWPSVYLTGAGYSSGGGAYVEPSGAIRFRSAVAAGKYVVNVSGMPAGMYVKSIGYGGQDGMREPIEVASGGGSIEVVMSRAVATVGGRVRDAEGNGIAGVVVTAWPRAFPLVGGARSVATDQNGRFAISDLGPGEYFVAAWEEVAPGLGEVPEFLKSFSGEAARVALAEGAVASVELKPIARERIAEAEAKIR